MACQPSKTERNPIINCRKHFWYFVLLCVSEKPPKLLQGAVLETRAFQCYSGRGVTLKQKSAPSSCSAQRRMTSRHKHMDTRSDKNKTHNYRTN